MNADNADLKPEKGAVVTADSVRALIGVVIGSFVLFLLWLSGWLGDLPGINQLGEGVLGAPTSWGQSSLISSIINAGVALCAILTGILVAAGQSDLRHKGRALFVLGYAALALAIASQAEFPEFFPAVFDLALSWAVLAVTATLLFVQDWFGRNAWLDWSWRRWTLTLLLATAITYLPSVLGLPGPAASMIYAVLLGPPLALSLWWIGVHAARFTARTIAEALIGFSLWLWIALICLQLVTDSLQVRAGDLERVLTGAVARTFNWPEVVSFWTANGASPALALASGALIITGLLRAIESNARATDVIARQRRDLETSRAALEAETRRRTLLEERGRLMRDMHDGIGGHLLTLLLRLRAGGLAPEQIERHVEDCLTDLRLIVDSLDGPDGGLDDALHSLRALLVEQTRAAGVELDWIEDDAELNACAFDAREMLSICRFVQEAVTNAVRHSGGSRIRVAISASEPEHALSIAITDDGCGLSEGAELANGRGLGNLAARAEALGGACAISNREDASGVRVVLTLPLETRTSAPT